MASTKTPKKLVDLNPRWLGAGGEGVTRYGKPMPRREGIGISFDCPCDTGKCKPKRTAIQFKVALDGEPWDERGWDRTGDTFETLTLRPSILRAEPNGCKWHGWLRNGELISC